MAFIDMFISKKKLEQSQQVIYNLETKVKELEGQVKEERTKKQKAETLLKQVQEAEQNAKHQVQQLKEAQKELSPFHEVHRHYTQYMTLSEAIRQNLSTVIDTKDMMHFLISGLQGENIEALWDWLSYQLDNLKKEEQTILIETFHYFFEQYNNVTGLYETLDTKVGDTFDEEKHTRASESKVAGAISKVLLEGYKRKRTQKLMKKAIVRI